MIIDCISDLHGFFPKLDGGDLLIVAGDLTAGDRIAEYTKFAEWLVNLPYRKKVVIAGNHDARIESGDYYFNHEWLGYLCDSGTEFEGLKIWGSPWTSQFPGMNPKCGAFARPMGVSLKDRWDLIPDDVDILVTHIPPYLTLDSVAIDCNAHAGDMDLLQALDERITPKLHVFGHIHEHGGKQMIYKRPGYWTENNTICVNASIVDENYRSVNKPVRIEL